MQITGYVSIDAVFRRWWWNLIKPILSQDSLYFLPREGGLLNGCLGAEQILIIRCEYHGLCKIWVKKSKWINVALHFYFPNVLFPKCLTEGLHIIGYAVAEQLYFGQFSNFNLVGTWQKRKPSKNNSEVVFFGTNQSQLFIVGIPVLLGWMYCYK